MSPAWRGLALLLALGAGAALYTRVIAPLLQADLTGEVIAVKLERVSDGDTLHLIPGGASAREPLKVRLIGIDCAELGSADGFRAATAISLLCEGALKLELEPERSKDGAIKRDKYGRMLGWLWVVPGADWSRQRDWLLRYPPPLGKPGLGSPRSGAADFLRPPPGFQAQPRGQRTLVQEELLLLNLAELYRDAKGSKHYPRLETALLRSKQQQQAQPSRQLPAR